MISSSRRVAWFRGIIYQSNSLRTSQPPFGEYSPAFVTTKVVYVQFDDGTFWGDSNAKSSMDLQRQEEQRFYSQLAAAPSEADFVIAMNAPKPGTSEFPAAHPVKMAYSQSGFASALAIVNDRLTLANNRYATGKF
jgi:hypothetical protein